MDSNLMLRKSTPIDIITTGYIVEYAFWNLYPNTNQEDLPKWLQEMIWELSLTIVWQEELSKKRASKIVNIFVRQIVLMTIIPTLIAELQENQISANRKDRKKIIRNIRKMQMGDMK